MLFAGLEVEVPEVEVELLFDFNDERARFSGLGPGFEFEFDRLGSCLFLAERNRPKKDMLLECGEGFEPSEELGE